MYAFIVKNLLNQHTGLINHMEEMFVVGIVATMMLNMQADRRKEELFMKKRMELMFYMNAPV